MSLSQTPSSIIFRYEIITETSLLTLMPIYEIITDTFSCGVPGDCSNQLTTAILSPSHSVTLFCFFTSVCHASVLHIIRNNRTKACLTYLLSLSINSYNNVSENHHTRCHIGLTQQQHASFISPFQGD